jgi:hypothetical protein
MPLFVQPALGRLREFNKHHEPKGTADRNSDGRGDGGQFAKRDGGALGPDQTSPMPHDLMVGITSYRGKDQPGDGDRTNAAAFGRMHDLQRDLQAAGLAADVRPAQGAWDGAWEPSWAVGIDAGDSWDASAALRTLATYGKRFNQDAILLMHRCVDDCNSEYAELAFEGPIGRPARDAIGKVLVAEGMGGWTWFKRGGKTMLRMAHVPPWSDRTPVQHAEAVRAVHANLASAGYTAGVSRFRVRVEVMEREARAERTPSVRSYDEVLQGTRDHDRPLQRGKDGPAAGWPAFWATKEARVNHGDSGTIQADGTRRGGGRSRHDRTARLAPD